ncbi:hypothetical protein [Methanobrevibacter sp.]|uniref:hypothetical protein n=1 Tax=Methanobrevibacter sp. TaxID=66852 RepID=UPI003FA5BB90
MLNPDNTKNILNGNIDQFLDNLYYLDLKKTTFRIPVSEFSLIDEKLILDILKKYPSKKVEIFKLHNLAKRKYEILNKDFYHDEISDNQLSDFKDKLNQVVPTVIIEMV